MTLPAEGNHPAIAVPHTDGRAVSWGYAGTGTKQLLVHFELLSGPHAGDVFSWFGSLTKDAVPYTMTQLRTAGFKGKNPHDVKTIDQLAQVVSVKIEHDDEKKYARVGWINPLGGSRVKMKSEMTDADVLIYTKSLAKWPSMPAEVDGISRAEWAANQLPDSGTDKPAAQGKAPVDDGLSGHDEPPPPMDNDLPF